MVMNLVLNDMTSCRHDVTMTLFDVKCLINGKIDVFRNISEFRLNMKLRTLISPMCYLSASRTK